VHNEEIHNFHSSPDIIRMTKSQRMRQMYTIHTGVRRNAYRNSAESLKAPDLMEELGVHICTVLKWILKTKWIGFIIWRSRG